MSENAAPSYVKKESKTHYILRRILAPILNLFKKNKIAKWSTMRTWAEREVSLACERERESSGTKHGDFDYGCACYESALKAYESLMQDGHSGFSIKLTKNILDRLLDGLPLTPINDTDDDWINISEQYGDSRPDFVTYQCRRMYSLFKYVYADGSVKYHSNDASYCVDINTNATYTCSLVSRIIDELYPISMPYSPDEPIKVFIEGFLYDDKNGDFNTTGVLYAILPDESRVDINRFFKEINHDWSEINNDEYDERKTNRIVRNNSI